MGTITYDSAANKIIVSDYDPSTYVTLEDIYQADVSGGWGVVDKIGDLIYRFHCRLKIKDSNFWERNKVWAFVNGIVNPSDKLLVECQYSQNTSYYFRLGEITNLEQRTCKNGCIIVNEEKDVSNNVTLFKWFIWGTDTVIDILATTFKSPYSQDPVVATDTNDYGTIRFWNVYTETNGFQILCLPDIAGLWGSGSVNTNEDTERVFLSGLAQGIWAPKYLRNVTLRNCGKLCTVADQTNVKCINVDSNTWLIEFRDWAGPGLYGNVSEIYTLDLLVQNKNGYGVAGATVKLYDKDDNLLFEDQTDGFGRLSTKEVKVRLYEPPDGWTGWYNSSEPKVDYNPFRLVVEHEDYFTAEFTVSINSKVDWLCVLTSEPVGLDELRNELNAHRNATEGLLQKTFDNTQICINDKYGLLLKPPLAGGTRRLTRLVVKDKLKLTDRLTMR